MADTSQPGCELVNQWLREYNWMANPDFMAWRKQHDGRSELLVLLATVNSVPVGGLFAETQLSWLRITIMAVSPNWRSQGVGSTLLTEAEKQAISRGCIYAYVDTMDYQTPSFYLKHGFSIVGKIPDWDSHGHAKLYLSKNLTPTKTSL